MLRVSIGPIWMKTSALKTCYQERLPARVRIRSKNGWKNERRSLAIPHRELIPCLTNMTTIGKQIPDSGFEMPIEKIHTRVISAQPILMTQKVMYFIRED